MKLRFPSISLVLCLLNLSFVELLDSENNEPVYKFGILAGEPNSLNGSTSVSVSNFEECVQKCEEDFECILASQVADGEPCNLFDWNTVTGVRKNESGGEGLVAFRVYTNQPACELNLPLLLNGKTYRLFENNTDEYLWRIDTSEDGFTITYIACNKNDAVVCGNWAYNRPYSDGCDPECQLTMVQVYAEPGPLSVRPGTIQVANWDECVKKCYEDEYCIVATLDEADPSCYKWGVYDELYFLNKTQAADGKHAAIKMNLNNETCLLTTELLLNDTYVMSDGNIKMAYRPETAGYRPGTVFNVFYRVRTTPNYYKLSYYSDESVISQSSVYGCPQYFYADGAWFVDQGNCYHPFAMKGLTQSQAKELCQEMDAQLESQRWEHFMNYNKGGLLWLNWFAMKETWGVTDVNGYTAWMGLERDPECVGEDSTTAYCKGNQQWQWADPSIPVLYRNQTSKIAFSWAPGEPDTSSSKMCGYLKFDSSVPESTFYAADCNQTDMRGFICSMFGQQHVGVATYKSIAQKYGYV